MGDKASTELREAVMKLVSRIRLMEVNILDERGLESVVERDLRMASPSTRS